MASEHSGQHAERASLFDSFIEFWRTRRRQQGQSVTSSAASHDDEHQRHHRSQGDHLQQPAGIALPRQQQQWPQHSQHATQGDLQLHGARPAHHHTQLRAGAPLPPLHRSSAAAQPHAAGPAAAASILQQQQHHRLLSSSTAHVALNAAAASGADGGGHSQGFSIPTAAPFSWASPTVGLSSEGPQESVADAEPANSASPTSGDEQLHHHQHHQRQSQLQQESELLVRAGSAAASVLARPASPDSATAGQHYNSSSFRTPKAMPKKPPHPRELYQADQHQQHHDMSYSHSQKQQNEWSDPQPRQYHQTPPEQYQDFFTHGTRSPYVDGSPWVGHAAAGRGAGSSRLPNQLPLLPRQHRDGASTVGVAPAGLREAPAPKHLQLQQQNQQQMEEDGVMPVPYSPEGVISNLKDAEAAAASEGRAFDPSSLTYPANADAGDATASNPASPALTASAGGSPGLTLLASAELVAFSPAAAASPAAAEPTAASPTAPSPTAGMYFIDRIGDADAVVSPAPSWQQQEQQRLLLQAYSGSLLLDHEAAELPPEGVLPAVLDSDSPGVRPQRLQLLQAHSASEPLQQQLQLLTLSASQLQNPHLQALDLVIPSALPAQQQRQDCQAEDWYEAAMPEQQQEHSHDLGQHQQQHEHTSFHQEQQQQQLFAASSPEEDDWQEPLATPESSPSPSQAQHTPQHNTPQYDTPRRSMPEHSMPQHSMPQHSMPSEAAQNSTPQHSMPQYSLLQHSTPQHSVSSEAAQNSTPQHSMPLHSAAQRSTPQQGPPGPWVTEGSTAGSRIRQPWVPQPLEAPAGIAGAAAAATAQNGSSLQPVADGQRPSGNIRPAAYTPASPASPNAAAVNSAAMAALRGDATPTAAAAAGVSTAATAGSPAFEGTPPRQRSATPDEWFDAAATPLASPLASPFATPQHGTSQRDGTPMHTPLVTPASTPPPSAAAAAAAAALEGAFGDAGSEYDHQQQGEAAQQQQQQQQLVLPTPCGTAGTNASETATAAGAADGPGVIAADVQADPADWDISQHCSPGLSLQLPEVAGDRHNRRLSRRLSRQQQQGDVFGYQLSGDSCQQQQQLQQPSKDSVLAQPTTGVAADDCHQNCLTSSSCQEQQEMEDAPEQRQSQPEMGERDVAADAVKEAVAAVAATGSTVTAGCDSAMVGSRPAEVVSAAMTPEAAAAAAGADAGSSPKPVSSMLAAQGPAAVAGSAAAVEGSPIVAAAAAAGGPAAPCLTGVAPTAAVSALVAPAAIALCAPVSASLAADVSAGLMLLSPAAAIILRSMAAVDTASKPTQPLSLPSPATAQHEQQQQRDQGPDQHEQQQGIGSAHAAASQPSPGPAHSTAAMATTARAAALPAPATAAAGVKLLPGVKPSLLAAGVTRVQRADLAALAAAVLQDMDQEQQERQQQQTGALQRQRARLSLQQQVQVGHRTTSLQQQHKPDHKPDLAAAAAAARPASVGAATTAAAALTDIEPACTEIRVAGTMRAASAVPSPATSALCAGMAALQFVNASPQIPAGLPAAAAGAVSDAASMNGPAGGNLLLASRHAATEGSGELAAVSPSAAPAVGLAAVPPAAVPNTPAAAGLAAVLPAAKSPCAAMAAARAAADVGEEITAACTAATAAAAAAADCGSAKPAVAQDGHEGSKTVADLAGMSASETAATTPSVAPPAAEAAGAGKEDMHTDVCSAPFEPGMCQAGVRAADATTSGADTAATPAENAAAAAVVAAATAHTACASAFSWEQFETRAQGHTTDADTAFASACLTLAAPTAAPAAAEDAKAARAGEDAADHCAADNTGGAVSAVVIADAADANTAAPTAAVDAEGNQGSAAATEQALYDSAVAGNSPGSHASGTPASATAADDTAATAAVPEEGHSLVAAAAAADANAAAAAADASAAAAMCSTSCILASPAPSLDPAAQAAATAALDRLVQQLCPKGVYSPDPTPEKLQVPVLLPARRKPQQQQGGRLAEQQPQQGELWAGQQQQQAGLPAEEQKQQSRARMSLQQWLPPDPSSSPQQASTVVAVAAAAVSQGLEPVSGSVSAAAAAAAGRPAVGVAGGQILEATLRADVLSVHPGPPSACKKLFDSRVNAPQADLAQRQQQDALQHAGSKGHQQKMGPKQQQQQLHVTDKAAGAAAASAGDATAVSTLVKAAFAAVVSAKADADAAAACDLMGGSSTGCASSVSGRPAVVAHVGFGTDAEDDAAAAAAAIAKAATAAVVAKAAAAAGRTAQGHSNSTAATYVGSAAAGARAEDGEQDLGDEAAAAAVVKAATAAVIASAAAAAATDRLVLSNSVSATQGTAAAGDGGHSVHKFTAADVTVGVPCGDPAASTKLVPQAAAAAAEEVATGNLLTNAAAAAAAGKAEATAADVVSSADPATAVLGALCFTAVPDHAEPISAAAVSDAAGTEALLQFTPPPRAAVATNCKQAALPGDATASHMGSTGPLALPALPTVDTSSADAQANPVGQTGPVAADTSSNLGRQDEPDLVRQGGPADATKGVPSSCGPGQSVRRSLVDLSGPDDVSAVMDQCGPGVVPYEACRLMVASLGDCLTAAEQQQLLQGAAQRDLQQQQQHKGLPTLPPSAAQQQQVGRGQSFCLQQEQQQEHSTQGGVASARDCGSAACDIPSSSSVGSHKRPAAAFEFERQECDLQCDAKPDLQEQKRARLSATAAAADVGVSSEQAAAGSSVIEPADQDTAVDGSAAHHMWDAMLVDGGDAITTGDDSPGVSDVSQAAAEPHGAATAAKGNQAVSVGGVQGEVEVPAAKRRRFEPQWQHKNFEESLRQFPGVLPGYLCALACLGVDVKALLMQA